MTVSTSNKKKECCAIQVMKDQGMSTSYTILLFYITLEAATGSVLD